MSSQEEFDRNRKYYLAVQYLLKLQNNGELDQYYASESHEAIISQEDFLAVAALMAEKSEYYGRQRPTSPYPLTKKLRCSRCGAFYIRRTGKGYTICHASHRLRKVGG